MFRSSEMIIITFSHGYRCLQKSPAVEKLNFDWINEIGEKWEVFSFPTVELPAQLVVFLLTSCTNKFC